MEDNWDYFFKSLVANRPCDHNHWSLDAAYKCACTRAIKQLKQGTLVEPAVVYAWGQALGRKHLSTLATIRRRYHKLSARVATLQQVIERAREEAKRPTNTLVQFPRNSRDHHLNG